MIKRAFDFIVALIGLICASPVLLPVLFLIWKEDKHSPFYMAPRVSRGGGIFTMVKLRSMVINADKSGVDSTAANDRRITPVGHFVRRYKLDELTQLWNVLIGDMSLVGPRPNVKRDTDLYTDVEKKLLSVRPGITDLASIVFSDEGDILKGAADPDLLYNQIIRPWKSRLALLYIDHSNILLDLRIVGLTAMAIINKQKALQGVQNILQDLNAPAELKRAAARQEKLMPYPPPGATQVVASRQTTLTV